MDKIAADAEIDTAAAVKAATHGFVAMLGSPASDLKPAQVQAAGLEFAKRASQGAARHNKIKEIVLAHANS